MNWSWLLPEGKGIPVLMYHKVWPGTADDLTITPQRLREHWAHLEYEGYHTLSLPHYLDIITGKKPQHDKAILITFDDGYRNNLTYAYPLLKEFGWQATFFIITNTLDGVADTQGGEADQKMTIDELRQLDPSIVQLSMHGYSHGHMGNMTAEQLEAELTRAVGAFERSGLDFQMIWAYPYGGRPGGSGLAHLKQLMARTGIKAAFRIGNKVSKVPPDDVYEIKRIDIKGTDTIQELKIKLKKGKLKPF